MIDAKIVADSMDNRGNRLTTFVLRFPRIVLAEFNTHRMLSKNSASSRAIPFEKMLKMVEENPFIPIKWMKEHKGMQGTEYFTDLEVEEKLLLSNWLLARDNAVKMATNLSNQGLTKQVVNRLLEPFMWHTVIVTGSDWQNFFALRAHPAAEIHIAALAEMMLNAYNESTPKLLKYGEWHIPFGDNIDFDRLQPIIAKDANMSPVFITPNTPKTNFYKVKIATARCARVSYLNFEGKDDYEADLKLFEMLSGSGHWSPFEHCAKIMTDDEYFNDDRGIGMSDKNAGWCGNFRGFKQLRKTFDGENKKDERVINKVNISIE